MSGNTSATGGFLTGTVAHAAEDIEDAIQQMVAQVSGLPGNLMRRRWQPMPPVQPAVETTWGAVGITKAEADEYVFIKHVDTPEPGYDLMQRHLTFTVIVSFYGPHAEDAASALRDGAYLPQNYEPLIPFGLKLRTVNDLARNPELINTQFINRIDMILELRMQQDRQFPVQNLLGADIVLNAESMTPQTVTVRPAP